jgi:hypothetical protein
LKHAFDIALTAKPSVGTARMFLDLLTVEAAAKQDERSVAVPGDVGATPVLIRDTQ